ncbi:MAG: c-type cytochrome [Deltaproteobacteria bacterium]|nr:c-type cytochrome [Deltaproteobacteria bacterium]
MKRRTRGLLVLLTAVILNAVIGYEYLVTHTFSARAKPSALEALIARKIRGLATAPVVKRLKNPLDAAPLPIAEGRDHFADHCAFCHGNDGSGKTPVNEGLYPPAPDLREANTQHLSDGEIFWIIQNGIRFTGMPGWGGEDEENWKLVLFIRHLPQLSPEELRLMKEVNG